jgi:hypothetical protein
MKYLPQSCRVKNEWSHTFTPSIRLRGLWKDKYTFTFNSNRLVVAVAKNTVRSESRCALRLRYVDLVVSIEVFVEVCCCFTVFSC